jgi:hypothetical protein
MQLTEDSWRALARSSPWRWRTLHFTRTNHEGDVEAWVRRPGQLLVHDHAHDRTSFQHDPPPSASSLLRVVDVGGRGRSAPAPQALRDLMPHEVHPPLRTDGLVATRPHDVSYDDPLWQSYTWVAMLDPVELSEHTLVEDLRPDVVAGRSVWRAVVRADEGYDPRCSCCPLLWSEQSVRLELEELDEPYQPSSEPFPEAYQVALDAGTGIVTDLRPVGVDDPRLAFTVLIHEVDAPLDAVFARWEQKPGRVARFRSR